MVNGTLIRADRPGIALLVVVLVTMVVSAIAAAAALIGANAFLISEYDQKTSMLESVADAGLELGRARLNADPSLYSDTALAVLERDAAVYDVDGAAIPGVTRTVYVLPVGGGVGEFGNYATAVAIARDDDGGRVIRRLDLLRESFASYAYFTDREENIAFGNQDELFGPVHSNSTIEIRPTGASFHGPVTTAGGFEGAEYAEFHADTTSGVLPIRMPTSTELERLERLAEPAHLTFTAPSGSVASSAQATLRIEFVSRDVDGDGVEEGFIRAYQSSDGRWVTAGYPYGYYTAADAIANSPNCGYVDGDGWFYDATTTKASPSKGKKAGHKAKEELKGKGVGVGNPANACFLGGTEILTASGSFEANDGRGEWIEYPGPISSDLAAAVAAQPDGAYLFPVDRRLNPAFRGVIFVRGSVVVSGTVRSRVTLASTRNIIIGDDLVYATDPGAATCTDILGLFSGDDVYVADNTINAPQRVISDSWTYYELDDTPDEFIHATILARDKFQVENPGWGATAASACGTDAAGNPIMWGRGCLRVTGGIIQETRGVVAYGSGTGYVKRYTHDTCGFTAPPPYFPSTGHFFRGRTYEIEPVGFDIAGYFDALN